MLTFAALRTLLIQRYHCDHTLVVRADEVFDPVERTPSCAVHGFERRVGARQLLATIPVHHERLPIHDSELRPFLERLEIDPAELQISN